jgi:hypothetical protein
MPKLRLTLRFSQSEYDYLCRYARENGDISLNDAMKQILSRIRRGDAKLTPISCGDGVIQ